MQGRVAKDQLGKLVDTALRKAGQVDYLLGTARRSRCRILLTVGYHGDRDVKTRAFLHQDTSLFTILMYRNTQAIPGPELIANPQGLDWNWKMMQYPKMPEAVKDDLRAARASMSIGEEMRATEIPAHGLIGFPNALYYHTTPHPGSRGIPLATLNNELDAIFDKPGEDGLRQAVRDVIASLPRAKKLYKADLLKRAASRKKMPTRC